MRTALLAVLALHLGTPVSAQDKPPAQPPVQIPAEPKPRADVVAEVVERNDKGEATRVRVEGRIYEICRDGRTDGCINPRDAGLDFGTVPLDHWPGKPASESR